VTPDDNNFPRIVSNIAEVMKTILVKNDSDMMIMVTTAIKGDLNLHTSDARI